MVSDSIGLNLYILTDSIFSNRSGGPESGEDPAHRCSAQPVYIPPPREHSAACGVPTLQAFKDTFKS